jgi:DNA replication protein DnaC
MPCPVCDDTGWKAVEQDGVRRVARCECWRDRIVDKLLADARIPRRYQHCDLDNFLVYNEQLTKAVGQARRLAEVFPVVDRGLFLLGPPGVGKTHLAVATLKQVIRTRGARGLFYDTRDLLRVIRSTYDPVVRTTEIEVLRPVMQADLLVLDDLGAEKTSEWVEETLNLIVNTRYNERRTTIFTSNYEDKPDTTDPDALLVRIGFRMRSRLHEMCEFLDLDGADYRELPPNGGVDDLLILWKRGRPTRRTLPSRAGGQARAQLRSSGLQQSDGKADLKWPGGRAGT